MPHHEPAQTLACRPRRERPGDPGSTIEVPRIKPRDPVARAIVSALETAFSRIRGIEAAARRGDAEGIHRLRTATRRLRSELRAFRPFVDSGWIGPLAGEMKSLAGLLGNVRDLDVLTARFHKAAEENGLDPQALAPLFEELMTRHARALHALRQALQGDRYREIIASLQQAIDHPSLDDAAGTRCRTALPPLAAAAWRRLKTCARALRPDDPDEAFHEVRKRAKRARYIAEMVAPILAGADAKGARRFIDGATRIQDVLGEHQDAVVAEGEVTCLLARHPDDPAFTAAARRLLDSQVEAADAARAAFFDDWDKLDRRKARRWLKTVAKSGR